MNNNALDILAWTLLGEAGGEGNAGMAAVAHTIRNRANDPRWPSDPMAVALQPYQYSTWNDTRQGGNSPSKRYPKSSEEFQNARRIAEEVFAGNIPDPTGGATHYHTKSINPSWSSSVNQYGKIGLGNHVFYPERPTPPASLPEVATALDVIERVAPRPAPVDDRVTARNAFALSYAPPPVPQPRPQRTRETPPLPRARPTPPRAPQPMAADLSLTGSINPTTSRMQGGEVLNPHFSDLTPTSITGGVGSLTPTRQAPVPASVERRVTARNTALAPVARLPELPPPSPTRRAPTPASPSLPLSSARASAAAVPPALKSALNASVSTPRVDGVGAMPTMADMSSMFGVTPRTGVSNIAQAQDRLVTPGLPPANYGTVVPVGIGGPDMAMPHVPRPRPTVPTVAPRVVPAPAPRLERPGIFGTPKIGNWEVPLPGILGGINDFTKAIANASGPFNHGLDNLAYNQLRGGNFYAPGAATAQAGGYLFAPRSGGGWTNVGRARSGLTPAQLYEASNARNRRESTGSAARDSDYWDQATGGNSGRY